MPNRKEETVKNRPSPCPECPKYRTCRSLCEEVERWVSQDHVGGTNKILMQNAPFDEFGTFVSHGDKPDFVDLMFQHHGENAILPDEAESADAWDIILSLNLNKITLEFLDMYYRQGKRIRDIAILTGLSSQTIDRRHNQAKISIKKKLLRRKIWDDVISKRYKFSNDIFEKVCYMYFKELESRRDISIKLGVHPATVAKYIQKVVRTFSDRGEIDLGGRRV